MDSETKNCQDCKKDFIVESSDFEFYKKIKVPPPTFCFECRLKRKAAFINERALFKRNCDKCEKNIISIYSPESIHKVFCVNCYNDREDCTEFGVAYNFSKTFFEQFFELFGKVPKTQLRQIDNKDNCENSNFTFYSRNVYLSYTVTHSEDIFYSKEVHKGNRLCFDCLNILENERCYGLIDSTGNYNCRFLVGSEHNIDCAYLFNCKNCQDCCLSSNQQNKKYLFKNQQLTREEYQKVKAELNLEKYSSHEKLKKEFSEITTNSIHRFATITKSVNCTGDFIRNSKNVNYSFGVLDAENSKFIFFDNSTVRNCYDLFWTGRDQFCYELSDGGSGNNNVLFSSVINASYDISYSLYCTNSKNLFGCIGLKNKEYCILNKQYTKEEYEELVPKIIKHMNEMPYLDKKGRIYKYGEFFPINFSPFAYNESFAYEASPMSKEVILDEGYQWRDDKEKYYKASIQSNELPDSIEEVSEKILEEIIACPNKGQVETKCTFAYRIMSDELRFYKMMQIPLPHFCPNCRYYERRKWKNPWKLWQRKCMNEGCQNEFETSYSPDRPEIIYCEKCYQQEVS